MEQNNELFKITQEEIVAFSKAKEKYEQKIEEYKTTEIEIPDNFRAYNQDQMFFLAFDRNKFLEEKHPAIIIDAVIKRLNIGRL